MNRGVRWGLAASPFAGVLIAGCNSAATSPGTAPFTRADHHVELAFDELAHHRHPVEFDVQQLVELFQFVDHHHHIDFR